MPPALRDQNQTLINEFVRSTAYLRKEQSKNTLCVRGNGTHQPPPLLLKVGPKLRVSVDCTPHPALLVAAVSQLLPVDVLYHRIDKLISKARHEDNSPRLRT